jgi:hypothetical protein
VSIGPDDTSLEYAELNSQFEANSIPMPKGIDFEATRISSILSLPDHDPDAPAEDIRENLNLPVDRDVSKFRASIFVATLQCVGYRQIRLAWFGGG